MTIVLCICQNNLCMEYTVYIALLQYQFNGLLSEQSHMQCYLKNGSYVDSSVESSFISVNSL